MSLIVKESSGASTPPIDEGTYAAICSSVIDLGDQYNEKFDKTSPKVLFEWTIPSETIEIKGEEVPRTVSQTFTASLSDKASLRKMLESWRGKKFTPEELNGFDLRNVAGVPCFISIIHATSKDGTKTYANVASIAKLPKGMPAPQFDGEITIYEIDEDPIFEKATALPEWMFNRIKTSEQYKAFENGTDAEPFGDAAEVDDWFKE